MQALLALTRRALEEAPLQIQGQAIVVAVSGGADSLALLHLLWGLRSHFNYRLWVAHLDHGLRRGSEEDADFVQRAAAALGLPAVVERRTMPLLQSGGSLEAKARQMRYAFLREVASRVGATAVAVAHTADDQAETVLLHLLRGSALPGLAGMREAAPWPETGGVGPLLLRPLLRASRKDTEAYCQAKGLAPRQDPTNRDLRYTRNRVRHRLLPLLEEYNPQIRKALGRLARAVSADVAFLEAEASHHLQCVAVPKGQGLSLPRRELRALPLSLQGHLLRLAYAQVAGSAEGLAQRHLTALLDLSRGAAGRRLDLPGGVRAGANATTMEIGRTEPESSPPAPATLPVPGTVSFGQWSLQASLVPGPLRPSDKPYRAHLDSEAAGTCLQVRTRRPGDRFQPLGMLHLKKLQDFLVDEGVPREVRHRLPLVEGTGGILWVVGRRIAHWARVTPQSRWVLVVEAQPLNGWGAQAHQGVASSPSKP